MTALSSASAKTTFAPLPPSSSATFFSVSAAALVIAIPARVEPVKDTMSTSGWVESCVPTPAPSPFTRLKTPGGSPASCTISAKTMDEIGAISEGFSTTLLPARIAGITFSVTWFIGQFHGVIRATTPTGSHATMLVGA